MIYEEVTYFEGKCNLLKLIYLPTYLFPGSNLESDSAIQTLNKKRIVQENCNFDIFQFPSWFSSEINSTVAFVSFQLTVADYKL